ncbi:MAG: Asp/Glu racemase [Pseudomonadota bacterium]
MSAFPYRSEEPSGPVLGLMALQADETIEGDFRRMFPVETRLLVTRVPSGLEVTSDMLAAMETALPAAAGLLPRGLRFDVIGYGCTSASAQIGSRQVAEAIRIGALTNAVADPLSALLAACKTLGISRIAFLSPYLPEVSERLRGALMQEGVETPLFGSFDEANEAKVVRIAPRSVFEAGRALVQGGGVDALFLSCTNLRTLPIVEALEVETGLPVLSSNLVLAWHMARLAGLEGIVGPGSLLAVSRENA